MSDEPTSYRSGSAAFEFHVGSALKAILPGAFQGAVIGALIVSAYFVFDYAATGGSFGVSDTIGVVMMFCFLMMVGTMAGMIVCAIYITLVGLPLALVMRRRVGTPAMLIATLVIAVVVGSLFGDRVLGPIWGMAEDRWLMIALALCFTIPTGVAYRHAIITERMLSFWSKREE